MQDESGGDDDDGNGGDDDRTTRMVAEEVPRTGRKRLRKGSVLMAVEGDVKDTKPTVKPDKPDRKGVAHKGAKGDIPMPAGLEPGYHR